MKQVGLGLKENWRQFTLLAMSNAIVGGRVGLERAILPPILILPCLSSSILLTFTT